MTEGDTHSHTSLGLVVECCPVSHATIKDDRASDNKGGGEEGRLGPNGRGKRKYSGCRR